MKKRFAIAVSTLALVGAVFAFQGMLSAETAPGNPIVLKSKKGNVTFKHATHTSESCAKCHHNKKDGKVGVACGECHKAKKVDGVPKRKNAFHKQCKDCHKAKKKGPTKCKECHIK